MLRPIRLAVIALLTAPAAAQFVNRATWLGLDEEGVRRDFGQGTGYFLDRFGVVVVSPWWERGLPWFANRADFRFGSTSSTRLTIDGRLDHRIDLGGQGAFRYHVLQAENRDARFLRNELALEYSLGGTTALFAQGSLLEDKSLIDVSAGAWLFRRRDEGLRLMLTAVDFVSAKSRVVEYVDDPYAAMLSGAFGEPDGHRVVFELGAQLPFEVQEVADGDRFGLQRWIGGATAHLRCGADSVLVAGLEAEWTDKHLRPGAAGLAATEDFERWFHQARIEWWQDGRIPWSCGVLHTSHDEDGERPFDAANDLRTRRREWFGILRTNLPFGESFSLEPQLFAGIVDDEFRDGVEVRDEHRFEGKINWTAIWQFSPDVHLALIVGTQLDEPAFGGGGAQFVARF